MTWERKYQGENNIKFIIGELDMKACESTVGLWQPVYLSKPITINRQRMETQCVQ